MDQIRLFTLRLFFTKGIGAKFVTDLLDEYGSILELYKQWSKSRVKSFDLANLDIYTFAEMLQKSNTEMVCFWEESYPSMLKTVPDYPIILFFVGNQELLLGNNLSSVVGSRTISSYGKYAINKLIPILVNAGDTVVSGMAYGVDSYSHRKTLEIKGNTIAVLPASPNLSTPSSNYDLYKKILDSNGLVISEFPPFTKITPGLFPRRNRIIAGLSQKTYIIEAGLKSGALITAKLAFDYNREVYAFPGNVTSDLSKGCNYLIKNNIAALFDFDNFPSKSNLVNSLSDLEKKLYYAILPGPKSVEDLEIELGIDPSLIVGACTNMTINGILNTDNLNKFYLS